MPLLNLRSPTIQSRDLAIALARVAAENRCRDVLVLDLVGESPVTDYFVIATGTSRPQMRTVAARIEEYIRGDADVSCLGEEGLTSDHWVLLDLVDVVVHVFAPDARAYYALELLWGDVPRVDWETGWHRPGATGRAGEDAGREETE